MEKEGRRFSDTKELPEKDVENPSGEAEVIEEDEAKPKKKKNKKTKDQRLKEKNTKKLEKLMKKKNKEKPVSEEAEAEPEPEEVREEAAPLSDRELERKKKQSSIKRKRIITASILLVVLFVVVFFATNTDKLSCHNISNFISYGLLNRDSDQRFPINIHGQSITAGNFARKGQDLCYTSDTKTVLLNNYGKAEYSVQHAFINPVLTVSENKVLVYNLGGKGFQIIEKEGQVYSSEADDNIFCAAMNKNGVYALVTQTRGYLSKLTVYDKENNQIFAYSFADYYVTSVTLNENGKQAVAAGVSAADGVASAAIYVLDFTKDKPLYFSEFEGDIIYEVRYLNDRCAAAVGGAASYTVNTSGGNIEEFKYEGRTLTAYDINTDTDTYTVSVSGSGDGRNCEILSFNSSGKLDKSFSTEDKVIALSTYKGRVTLLTNESVKLYGKDGNHYQDKALTSDPHAVVMFTSSDAYVMCTGFIDTVSL